jgi:hypothetical protein
MPRRKRAFDFERISRRIRRELAAKSIFSSSSDMGFIVFPSGPKRLPSLIVPQAGARFNRK